MLGRGRFKFTGKEPFPSISERREVICSLAQALTAAFQLLRPLPLILMNLFNCYARRNLIKAPLHNALERQHPPLPAGPMTWPNASLRSRVQRFPGSYQGAKSPALTLIPLTGTVWSPDRWDAPQAPSGRSILCHSQAGSPHGSRAVGGERTRRVARWSSSAVD